MTTTFPGAIDALPRPSPTSPMNVAPYQGSSVIDNISDAIEAIEAKLGPGASIPTTAGHILRVTGGAQTQFGAMQSGDIPTGLIQSSHIADGAITNVDVNAAAAIAYSKLALSGSIQTGDLVPNAVTVRVARQTHATTPSTTNTTTAVLADPKITIVTTVTSDILVWHASVFNDNPGQALVTYSVRIDSGSWFAAGTTSQPSSTGRWSFAGFYIFQSVAAGTHTIELGNGSNTSASTIQHLDRQLMAIAVAR